MVGTGQAVADIVALEGSSDKRCFRKQLSWKNRSSPLPAGLAPFKAEDGKSFTWILYGNGPGYKLHNGARADVTEEESSKFTQCGVGNTGLRVPMEVKDPF